MVLDALYKRAAGNSFSTSFQAARSEKGDAFFKYLVEKGDQNKFITPTTLKYHNGFSLLTAIL